MANQDGSKQAFFQALSYAWQFGYTIAVPLVVFGVLGRFLDQRFGTAPWLFLAGLIVSIIISSVALVIKALRIFRSVEGKPPPKPPA
jgi:F0F1-type ATP synthase assembly protein I